MNFRDFYDLLETATLAPPETAELDITQAIQIIGNASRMAFGVVPNAQVISKVTNDGSAPTFYLHGSGVVNIKTRSRNIEFYVRQKLASYVLHDQPADRDLIEMEVEFSWTWQAKPMPGTTSPKDHPNSFPVQKEMNPETMPILKAFKQLLLTIRKYPIVIVFVAITADPINPDMGGDPNRRGNLYSKILQACGYTQYDSGVWVPPGLAA